MHNCEDSLNTFTSSRNIKEFVNVWSAFKKLIQNLHNMIQLRYIRKYTFFNRFLVYSLNYRILTIIFHSINNLRPFLYITFIHIHTQQFNNI